MKPLIPSFLALLLVLVCGSASAQLNVVTGQTAQDYAEFIAGPGVTVSNATITGSPNAVGSFTTGGTPTGLGMTSGVIISSGNAVDAAGAEPGIDASTGHGEPGNAWLEAQSGVNSFDAVVLEFDFVPNADFAQFKFIFGSEEYPGFVCQNFNDLFAITIEGVSTPLALANIALIPGTATPVSINNVNDQGCGDPTYYVNNTGSNFIEYGGVTQIITAETQVICGETYHLAFMIADGFDGIYDSGCFIEENSLTTGNVTIQATSLGGDTAAIEGCADLQIELTLNGDPPAQDLPVSVWIGGGSTAQWGIDYSPIPELNQADSTVIIPAGQNSVTFNISPIADPNIEGTETIDLVAITSTCGTIDTFELYITEVDPLDVVVSNDTTICVGNAITWAQGIGGGGGYTYVWNNGMGTNDTIFPSPTETTFYTVTVSDLCNSVNAVDSVLIIIDDGPDVNAGNDVSVCIGNSIVLNGTTTAPGSTYLWSPPDDLDDETIANPISTPQADTEYILTVTRPDGCFNSDTMQLTLTPPPTADFDLPTVGCLAQPLVVEYTGNASASAQFNWNFDSGVVTTGSGGGPIAVYWDVAGTYNVELTVSWNGCLSPVGTNAIDIIGPPPINAGPDVSFCSGDSGPIGAAPIGGLTYSWSPTLGVADATASSTTVQRDNPTNDIQTIPYVLTATEQGCTNSDTVNVIVYPIPVGQFSVPDGKCFDVNSFDLLATGFFGPNATFDWDFGPVGFPAGSTSIQPQGVIFNAPGPQDVTLVVTDNGCVSNPFVGTIEVFEMPVADFSFDVSDGCEPLLVNFQDQSYNGNSSLFHDWNFGNGTSSTQQAPSATFSEGVYSVSLSVVTGQGCADDVTKSDIIEAYKKPDALFSIDRPVVDIIDPSVTVTNLADSVVSSDFTFYPLLEEISGFEVDYEYQEIGTYDIQQIVTTANGCKDTITSEVKVEPVYTFYIPTAFTPNNDRVNEVWIPQGESIRDFEMTIYNRWNQEIFYSASLDEGWDGTYLGKQVPQGVYVYSIQVMDVLGEPHLYRGHFSLIR